MQGRAVVAGACAAGIFTASAFAAAAAASGKVRITPRTEYGGITAQNTAVRDVKFQRGTIAFYLDGRKRLTGFRTQWRCPGERFVRQLHVSPADEVDKLRGTRRQGRRLSFKVRDAWVDADPGTSGTDGSASVRVRGRFFRRQPGERAKLPAPQRPSSIGGGTIVFRDGDCRVRTRWAIHQEGVLRGSDTGPDFF